MTPLFAIAAAVVSQNASISPPMTEAAFVDEIRQAIRGGQTDTAIVVAERCLRAWPNAAECHKLAGSAYARRAAMKGGDADDFQRARGHYQAFVDASPAAPDAPRVRQILEAVASEGRYTPPPPISPADETPRHALTEQYAEMCDEVGVEDLIELRVGSSLLVEKSVSAKVASDHPEIAALQVVDATHLKILGKTHGQAKLSVSFTGKNKPKPATATVEVR